MKDRMNLRRGLTSGQIGGFDEHKRCDQAHCDGSSTERRRELVNARNVTGRKTTVGICIYGVVDETKNSLAQRARAEGDDMKPSRIECHTADYGRTILWEIYC